jgi:hypothetical protein
MGNEQRENKFTTLPHCSRRLIFPWASLQYSKKIQRYWGYRFEKNISLEMKELSEIDVLQNCAVAVFAINTEHRVVQRIRDDNGYWNQIEAYIRDHSEAEFSHSLCPECVKKLYPDLND